MKKSLIVASYNKDLSWLNNINKDIKVYIYDKSLDGRYNDINCYKYERLQNIGRETQTYFYHIVKYYDELSDLNIFVQDDPFDHSEDIIDFINNDNIFNEKSELFIKMNNSYLTISDYKNHYRNKERTLHFDEGFVIRSLSNGSPHHFKQLNCDNVWNELFVSERPDKYYEFVPGFQMFITRENLKIRNILFYKKLLKSLEKENDLPWIIERIQTYIFDPKYKIR
jgi:hypothetical protein